MATLASDDFNRTAGGLGANWTTTTGLNAPLIVSNALGAFAIASDSGAYYSAISWPNDQWSEIRYVASTTANGGSLALVRCASGAATFYSGGMFGSVFGASASIRIERWTAGVPTSIATGTASVSVNDMARLEVVGTKLALKINGTVVLSATDSSIASGSAGVFVTDDIGSVNDHELDDWAGGNFNASVAWVHA